MSRIRTIKASDYAHSLEGNVRAYLTGDLKVAQEFGHVATEQVEIGIANYDSDGVDTPHFHPTVTEAQIVVSGFVHLLDITNQVQIELGPGDFYLIEPGVAHVQKAVAGTRVVIVKWPSLNDKTVVQPDRFVSEWLAQPVKR